MPAPAPPPSGAVGRVVSVTEREYSLEPARVHVPKPGLIDLRVRNAGTKTHGLVVETSVGKLQTGRIEPGRTAEIRVRLRAGLYRWYSPYDSDRSRGMSGRLTVGPGR